MPCPHNEISIVQRSHRQSAVAAAAYQSGEKQMCIRDRFCADCGSVMYQQRYQTDKRKQDCYICGNYKKRTHDCTAPVSYTHLDVYKRQVLRNASVHCWLLRNIIDKISIREEDDMKNRLEELRKQRGIKQEDLANALEAVSYTHLDVYKRQGLYCFF